MTDEDLRAAHKHSSSHRAEIEGSGKCGCFYCLAVFEPREIESWIDDGGTALCPRCPVDSVIGDASGFPVTDPSFLSRMHAFWFERTVSLEEAEARFRDA